MKLSEYEMLIASQLVEPSEITVSFEDIAGLKVFTVIILNLEMRAVCF